MKSRLYEGTVSHCRLVPRPHQFRYRLFMLYLDLDELDTVFKGRWFWSARGPNLAWFRRRDHFGDPAMPLAEAVRDLVKERTGQYPAGPIGLLTHLRYFGYCINPISLYYCWSPDGRQLQHVVAEVTNTPWGERHCYVIAPQPDSDEVAATSAKVMHVSPFMPMDQVYQWQLSLPGTSLRVRIASQQGGTRPFVAQLELSARAISGWNLAAALGRFPLLTLRILLAIYWQALRLLLKGVPVVPHPSHTRQQERSR